MNLDAAVNELYGLLPSEFVASRTKLIEQARSEGRRPLAIAIGKLKKPTVAAWVLNVLSRDNPRAIDDLLQLGIELGEAHRRLSACELRELSTRRQMAIRSLTARTRELADENGHPVGDSVLRDVAQTLGACLAEREVAQDLRRGRVLAAARYSGFGPVGLSLVSDPDTDTAPEEDGSDTGVDGSVEPEELAPVDPQRITVVEVALAEARVREEEARVRLGDAETRVAEVTNRIAHLRCTLENAEQEGQFAIHAREDAQTELADLAVEIGDAEAELRELRDRLASR
ncbi:MAG: hypothetical protein GX542_05775 [Rhodococcus sp.]|nr:hypothetical protein [Rhodococcus sp. (in: high G+C Gram-positive bacteria)]